MTVTTTGARHRAACRPTTPLTALGQAVTGPAARRGMLVAASSGFALTMAASTGVAAPARSTSVLPQADASALANQARTALTVSPTVSVPIDVEFSVAQVAVAAIPPKTTAEEGFDPIAEHIAAQEAARRAADKEAAWRAAAAEPEALAATRTTETASRSAAPAGEQTSQSAAAGEQTPQSAAESTTAESATAETTAATAQSVSGNAVVDIAFRYVGTPYVWGGKTPAGFDCSGFTWYVFQQLGIDIATSSAGQRDAGTVVSASEARPGDLVWWPGHVGIYTGEGNHIAARNPSKPLQAGPLSHVGRGTPTFIRVG